MSLAMLGEDGNDSADVTSLAGRSRSVDRQREKPSWQRLSTWPEVLPDGWK